MYTVDELIQQVRFSIQEANTSQVSDQVILDKLNKAKNYAYDKMAKHYPDPLIDFVDITTSDLELDIPETAFQDRVLKVEYFEPSSGRYLLIKRTTYRKLGDFSINSPRQYPDVWATYKRKIRFASPYTERTIRIWFIKDIGKLVKQQGRVDSIVPSVPADPEAIPPTAAERPYITVDQIGPDLSVSDTYKKYVSVIDSSTGELKVSLQLESLDNPQIIFKESPTRDTVLNVPVSGEEVLDAEDPVIELDDYICELGGTCVVYFEEPMINFMMQYATNEIREDLGTIKSGQDGKLRKFEEDIIDTKAGRETTRRRQNTSALWRSSRLRRNFRK